MRSLKIFFKKLKKTATGGADDGPLTNIVNSGHQMRTHRPLSFNDINFNLELNWLKTIHPAEGAELIFCQKMKPPISFRVV